MSELIDVEKFTQLKEHEVEVRAIVATPPQERTQHQNRFVEAYVDFMFRVLSGKDVDFVPPETEEME